MGNQWEKAQEHNVSYVVEGYRMSEQSVFFRECGHSVSVGAEVIEKSYAFSYDFNTRWMTLSEEGYHSWVLEVQLRK